MTTAQKYDLVNKCESYKELADAIRKLGEPNGFIAGRSRVFEAEKMAVYAENFDNVPANALTREFGIRQQALYIQYYNKKSKG